MPKFLEDRLRRQAAREGLTGAQADRYVFGAMNNLGAMRGNQETPKGRAMAETHAHPHRLAGRHDGGLYVTTHHRRTKRR